MLKKVKIGQASKQTVLFTVISVLFLVGMLYGVLLIGQPGFSSSPIFRLITGEYFTQLQSDSPFGAMFSACISTWFYIFAAYLCGFSGVGQPFVLSLPFWKGLGLGYFMAYLYRQYYFSGVCYSLLLLLPQTLVSLFCLMIACREGLHLSNLLFGTLFRGRAIGFTGQTWHTFFIKLGVLLAIGLFGSLLSGIGTVLFGSWFQF